MILKTYQIDAFATKVFEGNPAMVVPLDVWLDDALMQKIAQENNLSETAFFVQYNDIYELRWFTPAKEVDMCGHATLASAYVLFECMGYEKKEIVFSTKSGNLHVKKEESLFVMNFPLQPIVPCDIYDAIEEAFGIRSKTIFSAMDYIVIFEQEDDVLFAKPKMEVLKRLHRRGVCISATSRQYDFVTRFFAPKFGVDEDPVTGSAFTQLAGYWRGVLGKDRLSAKQVSPRGGEVRCEIKGERVEISGEAVKYLEGEIRI